ncbi:MAG: type II secretion system F family protein [Treponema sp.]|nr:type II secretion system F family protein [Treponema sp.]
MNLHYPAGGKLPSFNRDTLLEFTEILCALLKAGLTLQDALELCGSVSSRTADLSRGLRRELLRGVPFHEALKQYPSFPPLYQSLVRLGERTGSAAAALFRMGRYLRAEKKIRGKLMNALWYPLFILVSALAGCLGILFYVMPRMTELFSAFNPGGGMPVEIGGIYTSIKISLSLLLTAAAAVPGFMLLRRKNRTFALAADRAALRLPLIGSLAGSIQTLHLSFAVEMLTSAGITLGSALKESASTAGNLAFRAAILEVHEELLRGGKLSRAFSANPIFPKYIGTWIGVGERTGSVEPVFTQIREYFQQRVDHGSERLAALIEPVLTLAAGLIVLFLIVQFVLPLFSLYGRAL